jgi:hypothetical protein
MGARARKALAKKIEEICAAKNLPAKALAEDAKCNVRTIRNFFNGKSVREETTRRIAAVVGVNLISERLEAQTGSNSADVEHGLYSEDLVRSYIGYFYAYRRSFSIADNLVRALFKLEWDAKRACLTFQEFQTYHSSHLARRVHYDQRGDVFISNTIGLVHLLTVQEGAVRLITLTRLHHDENYMRGVVLTQSEWPDHFQPSVSPIFFRKILVAQDIERLVEQVGPIDPRDPTYPEINRILIHTEDAVAKFARAPVFPAAG